MDGQDIMDIMKDTMVTMAIMVHQSIIIAAVLVQLFSQSF
jgi:hypothetical protein